MLFLKYENAVPMTQRSYDAFWRKGAYSVGVFYRNLPATDSLIWYENRDGFHAVANGFENTIQADSTRASFGLNTTEIYTGGIVLSNSSTASNPTEEEGSNTRFADRWWVNWFPMREAWQKGTIQFFPEYRDYDAFDWFKINQPYVITSQGSSGSELNELTRCREMLEATPKEVRRWMIDNARVGDVVSYFMRSNQYDGYLDPLSHRVVVDQGYTIDADIALAKSLFVDAMPPRLSISVVSDSNDIRDRNNIPTTSTIRTDEIAGFLRIDGTPSRTIEVKLHSDKPCEFHWIKCQGECAITFSDAAKSHARITIPHQCDFPVTKPDGSVLVSNRVEVVAVAFDGKHYSSPVFVTEYFSPQSREARPRMDEIIVIADDSFELKLNGKELMRGAAWNVPFTKGGIVWNGNDLIEVTVSNKLGDGGLLAGVYVGSQLHMTDASWGCSLDGVAWTKPQVIPHANSGWSKYFGAPFPNATWIWHSQAKENSTVYFRKRIGQQPEPQPTPSNLEERVAAVEAIIAKLKDALK